MTVSEKTIRAPQFRLIRMSILAVIIGILAGIAAEILDGMIGLVTNVAFYQRISTELISPLGSNSPLLLIFVPAIGGLIIGLMAKYGTPLVRGHGIPEAMEAVLDEEKPHLAQCRHSEAAERRCLDWLRVSPSVRKAQSSRLGARLVRCSVKWCIPPPSSVKSCWPAAHRLAWRRFSAPRLPR